MRRLHTSGGECSPEDKTKTGLVLYAEQCVELCKDRPDSWKKRQNSMNQSHLIDDSTTGHSLRNQGQWLVPHSGMWMESCPFSVASFNNFNVSQAIYWVAYAVDEYFPIVLEKERERERHKACVWGLRERNMPHGVYFKDGEFSDSKIGEFGSSLSCVAGLGTVLRSILLHNAC